MKLLNKLAVMLLLATPGVASAATQMQYIVYNAFDETVQSFQRLALITGDSVFVMMAGCFVAASIVMSASFFAAEGMAKKANNPFGFLIQAAAGLALFFGAVVPKGTIYVYDQVLNKNQAVGGIPSLIVFFAGGMNAVERELTRMVDTAAATPYSNDGGDLGYQMIYAASRATQYDADLERTIGQYVMDCGLTAVGTNQNGATMNELLRSSEDLRDTLEKYTHPSWPTTYYPANNSGGIPGSCADSWTYIKGQLDNVTGGPIDALVNQVCSEAGFDPADAAALLKCKSLQAEAAQNFGISPASSGVFLRNFIVQKGMMNMLMRPDFTASQGMLVNRSMMAEGFGSTEALNQWVPRIRAMMMALILGILPIPLLFVATNLVYKAVGLVIGLFVFMSLWGVTDAIAVQIARDAAANVFAPLMTKHVGFESLMLAPTASMQALAIYGKYRMMAMGMATLIAGALFKFSSASMGNTAEVAGNDVAGKGGTAGSNTMTPEGMQSTMGSLAQSGGAMAQVSTHGATTSLSTGAMPSLSAGAAQASYLEGANRGVGGRAPEGFDSMTRALGDLDGGGKVGKGGGLLEASHQRGERGIDSAAKSGSAETQLGIGGNIGGLEGVKRLADHRGQSVQDVSAGVSSATRAHDGEQTLSRQDSARQLTGDKDGDINVAGISGITSAATPLADLETASKMKGADPVEQIGELAKLKNASTEGLAEAAGGSPGRAREMFQTEHKTGLAKADVVRGNEGAVGHGQGVDAVVAGAGTNAAEAAAGRPAMVAGNTLQKTTAAAAGDKSQEFGGPAAVGRKVGGAQTVDSVVNAEGTNRTVAAKGVGAMADGNTLGKVQNAAQGHESRAHGGPVAAGTEMGEGQFKGSLATAKATNEVADHVGVEGIAKGEELAKYTAAASGAAAGELGGTQHVGGKIGSQRVASDLGSAEAREGAARAIVGDGMANRVKFETMSSGNMQAVLSGGALDSFLDNAVKNGMDAKQADSIRAKGAARAEFAFDKDKGAVQASLSGNFKSYTGSFATDENGQVHSYRDDNTFSKVNSRVAGDSVQIASPLMFGGSKMEDVQRSSQIVQDLMGPNMNNGRMTSQMRDVIAQTYSQRAELQGHSLGAEASTQYTDQESVSGSLDARVGKGGKFSAGGGVGAGVSASSSTTGTESHSARENAFTSGMRNEIDANWAHAQQATEKAYGSRESWDAGKAAEANRYLADQFSAGNENSFNNLIGKSSDATSAGAARAQGESEIADKWEHVKQGVKDLF